VKPRGQFVYVGIPLPALQWHIISRSDRTRPPLNLLLRAKARDVTVRVRKHMPELMLRTAELWKLQEIDSAIDARRATLDDARARLGESEELLALRARLEEQRILLRDARAAQKDLELQADDLRAKIAPAEEKLYGGSVRNPKELQDLQADIDQMKRHLSAIEDQDIAALATLEQAEADARATEAELAAAESAWRQEQNELARTAERLETEIAALEEERAGQAKQIVPDVLGLYDHVRRAHQGRGVARIERSVCQGCRIQLPASIISRARSGNGIAQCPNCERILFT